MRLSNWKNQTNTLKFYEPNAQLEGYYGQIGALDGKDLSEDELGKQPTDKAVWAHK